MRWLWLAAALLFAVAAAAVWFSFRDPVFIAGLTAAAVSAAVSAIKPELLRRMTPEQEKAFRDCVRRGGEWDHVRKRCK